MAITSITVTKVKKVGTAYTKTAGAALGALDSSSPAYVATYGTYGAKIPFEKKMTHYALEISNSDSAAANVLIRSNHHDMFIDEDLKIEVPASSTVSLQIETGKHVLLGGADKGYAYVVGQADTISVAVVELP